MMRIRIGEIINANEMIVSNVLLITMAGIFTNLLLNVHITISRNFLLDFMTDIMEELAKSIVIVTVSDETQTSSNSHVTADAQRESPRDTDCVPVESERPIIRDLARDALSMD